MELGNQKSTKRDMQPSVCMRTKALNLSDFRRKKVTTYKKN